MYIILGRGRFFKIKREVSRVHVLSSVDGHKYIWSCLSWVGLGDQSLHSSIYGKGGGGALKKLISSSSSSSSRQKKVPD